MSTKIAKWTNESVVSFAQGADPVAAITRRARDVVLGALDAGWQGPPFDPLWLASFLRLEVVPREDVGEARTVSIGKSRLQIEFNPNRPRGRQRFSIAHEIAHSLFADCGDRVRHRAPHLDLLTDDWQLEAMCNIAAAEFLMPFGSLPSIALEHLGVDRLLDLRRQFDVSMEALLIRVCEVTEESCVAFCSSRSPTAQHFRIDYAIPSRGWAAPISRGWHLPATSIVHECTGIGFTAKGLEKWEGHRLQVECVGVPPYPGAKHPRVVGILKPDGPSSTARHGVTFLKGDALQPRGADRKLIVHLVNDATPNWGGGFARALRTRWPRVQADFKVWAAQPTNLRLGNIHVCTPEDSLGVATMVAQKGYGHSVKPRIRYTALRECLSKVADFASREGCSVHMPRIGCGEAGGSWDIVQELITSALSRSGVDVTVYDLPNATLAIPTQQPLFS